MRTGEKPQSQERLLRVREAAERLGLQPSTIRAMVLQKRISVVRLSPRAIRITESEIARLIRLGTVPAREAQIAGVLDSEELERIRREGLPRLTAEPPKKSFPPRERTR